MHGAAIRLILLPKLFAGGSGGSEQALGIAACSYSEKSHFEGFGQKPNLRAARHWGRVWFSRCLTLVSPAVTPTAVHKCRAGN